MVRGRAESVDTIVRAFRFANMYVPLVLNITLITRASVRFKAHAVHAGWLTDWIAPVGVPEGLSEALVAGAGVRSRAVSSLARPGTRGLA